MIEALSPELDARVKEMIKKDPNAMPTMIAGQLDIPEASVVRAFPQSMQTFTAPENFDRIWEAMTGWEKTTFICQNPGAVVEIRGKLPAGRHGHGYFNLMEKDNPLGGHLRVADLGAICFLEKPFFGMESLSVQFYDRSGTQMFAVYGGRENRELIPSVKQAFHELKQEITQAKNKENPMKSLPMKSLIVYSSRTGNTRSVAEAVQSVFPAPCDIKAVEAAPDPGAYDFIAMGYWVDKGMPDKKARAYMEKIKGKKVGLFGTLGAYPDSEHADDCRAKAVELMTGNTVLGQFLCQGKIDPKVLEMMAKMASDHHPMTEERKARIQEAENHPDEGDFSAARQTFRKMLEKAGTAAAVSDSI